MRLLDFELDVATPFDFQETYMKLASARTGSLMPSTSAAAAIADKISETTLFFIRMALQNKDFWPLSAS